MKRKGVYRKLQMLPSVVQLVKPNMSAINQKNVAFDSCPQPKKRSFNSSTIIDAFAKVWWG